MKDEVNKCWAMAELLLISLILLANSLVDACAPQCIIVHVYSFPETSRTEMSFRFFTNKSDCAILFHNLNNPNDSERFLKIANILAMQGIAVVRFCAHCQTPYATWNDLWMTYGTPLMGFFNERGIAAITVGVTDPKILDKALVHTLNTNDDIKIFTNYSVHSLTDNDVKIRLEKFFVGEEESNSMEMNPQNLAFSIVLLALADSVNPCTFMVFTALLLTALYYVSRRKVAVTGSSFILAIFIGYSALGLGLFQILKPIPFISKIVASIGLATGAFGIVRTLKPNFKSPIPKSVRTRLDTWINKSYTGPIASFVLGLAVSITLLPCSGGPYVVGLGLLSTLRNSAQAYFLLILYNIIFVAPLMVILIALLAFNSLLRKIKAFRSSKRARAHMELISGTILVLICMYLILF